MLFETILKSVNQPEANLVLAAVFAVIGFYLISNLKRNAYTARDAEQAEQIAEELRAAMLRDELAARLNTPLVRRYVRDMKLRLGEPVEYDGHQGGVRQGRVVGSKDQGLHGQARISVGPGKYLVWRSWASLRSVA